MKLFCNTKEITGQQKDDLVAKLVLSNYLPTDIANLGNNAKLVFTEEFLLDFAFHQVRLNQTLTEDASEKEISDWKTVEGFFRWMDSRTALRFWEWDWKKQRDVLAEHPSLKQKQRYDEIFCFNDTI